MTSVMIKNLANGIFQITIRRWKIPFAYTKLTHLIGMYIFKSFIILKHWIYKDMYKPCKYVGKNFKLN